MRVRGLLVVLAGALACSLSPSAARAEPPDAEVAARLAFLDARLEAGTAAADRWWYGWFAGFGALTLGQYGIALAIKDPGFRADMAVGAVTSSLGLLPLGALPFTPRLAAAELRALPEGRPGERRRKLARAEALLRKSAEAVAFRRSWLAHLAGDGVSIASGFVLAGAYHRVRSGILNGIVGVAIVELQIFTLPRAPIADQEAYARGAWGSAARPRGPSFGLVPAPGGLGIGAHF